MQFIIEDATLAETLRRDRLLTSSLRHEPSFKHETVDDPDEAMAMLETQTPKKARKVKRFNFRALLPLTLSQDEAILAFHLQRVCFRSVSSMVSIVEAYSPTLVENSTTILTRCDPTSKDINRCAVFRTLYESGYTMVDGLKFGVDLLAYRGDPLKTHADYMILIVQPHIPPISMMDAVAMCTLAAKTRKQVIMGWSHHGTEQACFMHLLREPVNIIKERGRRDEEAILDEIPTIEALENPLMTRTELQQDDDEEQEEVLV